MKSIKILISHAHDERQLAEAWKNLLEDVLMGVIECWFSTDKTPEGGMPIGQEWRNKLNNELAECDFVLAIQTSRSSGRPWIMWECAIVAGIAKGCELLKSLCEPSKERGIIPVIYSMDKGDLTNPLGSYQVYIGNSNDGVIEVLERLANAAGLPTPLRNHSYTEPLETYLNAVKLHSPRQTLTRDMMDLWRDRFEKLVQSGRGHEITSLRQSMYASLPKPFQPVDSSVHELLSLVLMEQQKYDDASTEVDYALAAIGDDDVQLLHRKALALTEKHNLVEATAVIERILALDDSLRLNSEVASLQGRIHRERWQSTNNSADLAAAQEAYHRAYEADKNQYYLGVNAASLALAQKNDSLATSLFQEILTTCQDFQARQIVSFWTDFTAGEALLGIGDTAAALVEYQKGLTRYPPPQLREKNSALKGITRISTAKGLSDADVEPIKSVLMT